MKLSSRHLKESIRDDEVCRRAKELRITPEEVFARAYVAAGKSRSSSNGPFNQYCKDSASKIPDIVLEFCGKPLSKCSNPSCGMPDKPALFTKTGAQGITTYFCSPACMDATPQVKTEVANSAEGRMILERVRVAMSDATYAKVPPHKVRPMAGQPRVYFNPERMKRLTDSFKQVGQMAPGIVRRVPIDEEGHEYELLDGERRLRAAHMAGLAEYRAMVVQIDNEAAPYVVSVISNFNREEHTLLELSDSVVKMHEGLKLSMYEITEILGLANYNEASKLYGLRRLVPEVRDMLDPNLIKGHPLQKGAVIRISQEDTADQLALAQKMINGEMTLTGLKEYVQHVATSRGIALPQRAVSPDDRRKSVKSRIEALRRNAHELKQIMHQIDVPNALNGFPTVFLEELMQRIDAIGGELAPCRAILAEAAKEKKKSRTKAPPQPEAAL